MNFKQAVITSISSVQNPLIKHLIKQRETLPSIIKRREWNDVNVLIHGQKMVSECVHQYKLQPNVMLVSNEHILQSHFQDLLINNKDFNTKFIVTSDAIIQRVCNVQSTNGVCATFAYPPHERPQLFYSDALDSSAAFEKFKSCRRVVVINKLEDAGNLGTLLRSAYSFGYDAVVVLDGSVSPFNEKVVKSSRTVLFDLPIILCSQKSFFTWLHAFPDMNCIVSTCETGSHIGKRPVLRLQYPTAQHAHELSQLQKAKHACIMLNHEHSGGEQQLTTERSNQLHFVHIPMKRDYDSINVAQVAAIMLHYFQ